METFLAEAHEVPQNRCTVSLQECQTSVNKKDKLHQLQSTTRTDTFIIQYLS